MLYCISSATSVDSRVGRPCSSSRQPTKPRVMCESHRVSKINKWIIINSKKTMKMSMHIFFSTRLNTMSMSRQVTHKIICTKPKVMKFAQSLR